VRRRLSKLCWILVLAALVGGCTQASTLTPSPSPSRAVDYAAMETAIEDKISSGSLNLSTINAVLVSVDGETKVAHYRNGSRPEDALHVWSVTKSVVSALIGIAIDEKMISGLDATLPELLPRYKRYLSAEEKSITLRQLMSMTAGFPSDDPAPFENIHSVFKQRTDPIPMILTDGLDLPPGHRFSYSSRSSHLVSAVLRNALVRADGAHPRTVLEYAREKLFDPLEIDSSGAREERVLLSDPAYDVLTRFDWGTDAAGLHTACCLLRLRPADMLKFGELYLGGGIWHGKRILPTGWVEQMMTPGKVSPQYGLMWWLDIDPHGHPTWVARGSEGQLIAVVPEHHLVVAIGSVPTNDMGLDGNDMWLWVNDAIVPALE
jgi:CubicO group peptidase (beta-lactamase class C family)